MKLYAFAIITHGPCTATAVIADTYEEAREIALMEGRRLFPHHTEQQAVGCTVALDAFREIKGKSVAVCLKEE